MSALATFQRILREAVRTRASDILIRSDQALRFRIDGVLHSVPVSKDRQGYTIDEIEQIVRTVLNDAPAVLQQGFERDGHTDISHSVPDVGHFRIHILQSSGKPAIIVRSIPLNARTFEELNLPGILGQISRNRNGLILVAGPTGSGKSSTQAAIIQTIIRDRAVHVVTLEDPIEFHYPTNLKGTVTQREVGSDLVSFEEGLKAAMRENPDIIQAGEIRDVRMVEIALTAAETGHLVLATVHANTSLNALLRILAVFKREDQPLARSRLAENLRAIVTQRLLPRSNKSGRVAACDILINNSIAQTLIRDADRTDEIRKQMEEGRTIYGSQTLDQHLMELLETGEITLEHALEQAVQPEDLRMKLNLSGKFDLTDL